MTDISRVAESLSLSPREVWAVATVESHGYGFIAGDDRPALLFEAHQFHKLTNGEWDASHPNISSPIWDASLYGVAGAHQYDRLAEAMALDRDAALMSATWGMFQILGSNYHLVGFPDIDSFVAAMCSSEAAHLKAFAAYCVGRDLTRYLAAHDWENFKLGYNGPGPDDYAAKLAAAYADVLYPPAGMPPGHAPVPTPPTPPVIPPIPMGEECQLTITAAIDDLGASVSVIPADLLLPDHDSICYATITGMTLAIGPLAPGATTLRGADQVIPVTIVARPIIHLQIDFASAVLSPIAGRPKP